MHSFLQKWKIHTSADDRKKKDSDLLDHTCDFASFSPFAWRQTVSCTANHSVIFWYFILDLTHGCLELLKEKNIPIIPENCD